MEKIPFREFIKRERLVRCWSVKDLAEKTGLSSTSINSLETGRFNPRPGNAGKIMKAFKENPPILPDEVSL